MSVDPGTAILLTDQQRLDWLRLIRTDGVGPRTFRSLVNHFGGAAAALEGLPDLARARGAPVPRIPPRADIERECEAAGRLGVRYVAVGEAEYPAALAAIDSAPPLLAVRGNAKLLKQAPVAVVGSRNASAQGRAMTQRLAAGLGRAGYVVVSGLARGIDGVAHATALETGTVAVLAGGHDRPYPPEHADLLASIVERGAVVSEMPLGWEPRGRDFPRRNRLVSGLSLGVVLVEAARRSGSLITARFALEQGREVLAVPGSPLDPRSEGTNDLIRDGATLVRGVEDVIEVLAALTGMASGRPDQHLRDAGEADGEPLWDELDLFGAQPARDRPGVDREAAWTDDARDGEEGRTDPSSLVGGLLGPSPVSVNDLVRQSGLPARDVQTALLDLELAGRLERHGGMLVALRPA